MFNSLAEGNTQNGLMALPITTQKSVPAGVKLGDFRNRLGGSGEDTLAPDENIKSHGTRNDLKPAARSRLFPDSPEI
jgi:hypothetical protein